MFYTYFPPYLTTKKAAPLPWGLLLVFHDLILIGNIKKINDFLHAGLMESVLIQKIKQHDADRIDHDIRYIAAPARNKRLVVFVRNSI